MKYAKFIIAVLGAALTSAAALVSPGTTAWTVLQVILAALTAIGVYVVPNKTSGVGPGR